jgi:Bacterial regulatory helix-turn-helix protein, lysR family
VPELRHLRYFVAVAEELNFSRAARRLRMAQPPLSVAIRQLEQEIGASLFHRTSHEVWLTDAGRALLAGARRTLAEAEGAVNAAQRAGAGELGDFYASLCRSAGFEPKNARESSRTRWTLRTWKPGTAVLLPESVSSDLPYGTVAIRLSRPADLLQNELAWRTDDPNPILSAFVEVASGVFSPRPAARPRRKTA